MMTDPLNIVKNVDFDNRISSIEIHSHNPYANTSLGNNDEIRIPIQQQDLIVLPCDSYLYVEGKLVIGDKTAGATDQDVAYFDNNCVAFAFDEVRYEINGVEVDRVKNVGMTSTLKSYASMTNHRARVMQMAGWIVPDREGLTDHRENFDFCVPLNHLMGFFEDYKRVLVNVRHELILIRSRDDGNALYGSAKVISPKIQLTKIQWRVPHVSLDEYTKLQFLRILQRDDPITLPFRSWDLYEYPMLPQSNKHTWSIKASSQMEKPRYVIFALQNGEQNGHTKRNGDFMDGSISDIKLYLNSNFYPYDRLNTDFTSKKYATVYQMYVKFIESYYGLRDYTPLFDIFNFETFGPFFVIDCSHQNESIKTGTVDVKIEFECKNAIPHNTHAYCLIIHDRLVEYNPLTNNVRKLI